MPSVLQQLQGGFHDKSERGGVGYFRYVALSYP